jgi:hypothetical protein
LEINSKARIKDFVFERIAESLTEFALLLDFLKWCTFDINKGIDELIQKLFDKSSRAQAVLTGRANGDTLSILGDKMGITRERIRQIESKGKRNFSYWNSRLHILEKISADRNGDTILSPAELGEYFGENFNVLFFLQVCSPCWNICLKTNINSRDLLLQILAQT